MSNAKHNSRPNRESLSKRLGRVARQIKSRDGFACVYCGGTEASTGAHLHLDHLTPKSQGGEDVATNLVLACRGCNSSRKALSLSDWAKKALLEKGLVFTAKSIRALAARKLPEAV